MIKCVLFMLLACCATVSAQVLTVGAHGNPNNLSAQLTLEQDGTQYTFGAQWAALSAEIGSSIEWGPVGRLGYQVRAAAGLEGWGVSAGSKATVGPIALEGDLSYSSTTLGVAIDAPAGGASKAATLWSNLDVWSGYGADATGRALYGLGLEGALAAKYRLDTTHTVVLANSWHTDWATEAQLEQKVLSGEEQLTLSYGAGWQQQPYGILGARWVTLEGVLSAKVRLGGRNQLDAGWAQDDLKLNLTLYAWDQAKLELSTSGWVVNTTYNSQSLSLGARYSINLQPESEDLEE